MQFSAPSISIDNSVFLRALFTYEFSDIFDQVLYIMVTHGIGNVCESKGKLVGFGLVLDPES